MQNDQALTAVFWATVLCAQFLPSRLSFMYGGVQTVEGLDGRPSEYTPRGAPASSFTPAQRSTMIEVLERFASIMEDSIADERMTGVRALGFDTMLVARDVASMLHRSDFTIIILMARPPTVSSCDANCHCTDTWRGGGAPPGVVFVSTASRGQRSGWRALQWKRTTCTSLGATMTTTGGRTCSLDTFLKTCGSNRSRPQRQQQLLQPVLSRLQRQQQPRQPQVRPVRRPQLRRQAPTCKPH
jgi:hypothetical protein